MSVPGWLALGYAAVLVLVLAGTLITVVWLLSRIARSVRQIGAALQEVERHTRPLAGELRPLDDSLTQVAESLARVRGHLAAAEAQPAPPPHDAALQTARARGDERR